MVTIVSYPNFVYKNLISKSTLDKFLLNNNRSDTTTLTVDVFDTASSTASTTFTLATDTTQTDSISNVYFLQESSDGKFEIYFGDGIVGKALSDGNVVRLRYVVTKEFDKFYLSAQIKII